MTVTYSEQHTRRLGRFRLSNDLLGDLIDSDVVSPIFSYVNVIQVNPMFDLQLNEYVAHSPLFYKINPGTRAPLYSMEVEEGPAGQYIVHARYEGYE